MLNNDVDDNNNQFDDIPSHHKRKHFFEEKDLDQEEEIIVQPSNFVNSESQNETKEDDYPLKIPSYYFDPINQDLFSFDCGLEELSFKSCL